MLLYIRLLFSYDLVKEAFKMGRPKGGTNKKYSVEEKMKFVKMYLDEHKSSIEIQKETGINSSLVRKWIAIYIAEGIDGFKEKIGKRGNHFSALHTSKSLTKEERLELENMKLKIENERLKKGYLVKGVGADKEYVTFLEKNMK